MPKPRPDLWRVAVTVPEHALDAFEAALETHADAVSMMLPEGKDPGEGADWRLEAVSRSAFDQTAVEVALGLAAAAVGIAAPLPEFSRLVQRDWLQENLRSFPPIAAGRFFVHGSHWEGRVPGGAVPLLVDAGTAFGSGEHATTFGCLIALDRLAKRRRFARPLDMGCGSGILALAMAHLWPAPVLAADIDPESVRVARFNARRNQVGARVKAVASDGYRNPAVTRRRPYDLIVANILARPLCRMAPSLAGHLAPGGVAVLSGLLARQERQVLNAHRAQGLRLLGRVAINGWTTLVVGR
jgi:ribosomal protein L11 methyltransferase